MKHAAFTDPTKARQRRNLVIAIVGASVLVLGSLTFAIRADDRTTPVDTRTVSSTADKSTAIDGAINPNDSTVTTRAGGGSGGKRAGGGGDSRTDAEQQAERAERQAQRDLRQAEARAQRETRQNGATTTTTAPITVPPSSSSTTSPEPILPSTTLSSP